MYEFSLRSSVRGLRIDWIPSIISIENSWIRAQTAVTSDLPRFRRVHRQRRHRPSIEHSKYYPCVSSIRTWPWFRGPFVGSRIFENSRCGFSSSPEWEMLLSPEENGTRTFLTSSCNCSQRIWNWLIWLLVDGRETFRAWRRSAMSKIRS